MLSFNSRGLLIPDANIKSTDKELEYYFVTSITSTTRQYLFDKWREYCFDLKKLCGNIEVRHGLMDLL